MDSCAHFDAALCGQTSSQPHHFSPVGLHREISQRAWIGRLADVQVPSEGGMQRAAEHGRVESRIRPAPKCFVGLVVKLQELPSNGARLANAARQSFLALSVLRGEDALLE